MFISQWFLTIRHAATGPDSCLDLCNAWVCLCVCSCREKKITQRRAEADLKMTAESLKEMENAEVDLEEVINR